MEPNFERMFRSREKSGVTTMYAPTQSPFYVMTYRGSATPDYRGYEAAVSA